MSEQGEQEARFLVVPSDPGASLIAGPHDGAGNGFRGFSSATSD
jgi:hypothetical protein